ncbi:MAG TPA: hypothetical protein VE844_10995, partial [Gammaproteobacteria bacterium]|nr:hypothetical protein [Gammaproteobacteria bacterium]
DILLAIDALGDLAVTGDGMLECAPLLSSGLVEIRVRIHGPVSGHGADVFKLVLSQKGQQFVSGWKAGDQAKALGATMDPLTVVRADAQKAARRSTKRYCDVDNEYSR